MRTLLLRLTLRTPLHPTISRRFMLLTEIDGVTLDPAVPLRYAAFEGETFVMAKPGSTWWKVLDTGSATPCTVRRKGAVGPMTAILATGEAMDQAVLRYLQKYPGEWKKLGVDPQATAEDVEAAARAQAVIIFREPA